MSQQLGIKIAGLYTFPSDISSVPDGALSQADEIVIDREDTAEPRRGFDYLKHNTTVKSEFSDPAYRANKLFFYQGKLLAHYAASSLAYHDDTAGWTAISGTFSPPSSSVPVRSAQANQNLYFTTLHGVFKLDAYNGTARAAGCPAGLDLQASTATGTWLAINFRTAYRLVWGIKDANGNLILGAPSQREAITNTSGTTKSISIVATIPSGVTTTYFYQLYRAKQTDNTSSVVEPSDEMGLVYEGNPNSTDITNGYITIADITPDDLRGAMIYTAESQEGAGNANEPPPQALDLSVFRNCLFYANTSGLQNYTLTLLGCGSPNGIQANDTITIGSTTFTAKASETVASAQFAVATGGTVGPNIRDTALSLVRVINRYASSTYYAYYLSGASDLPGQIYITARQPGASAFSVTSSRATCWNPALPTSGTTQTSTTDALKNCVFFSKSSQPEAVPLGNYVYVGSADKNILRILSLRDSLFVLKEDGIFRIFGTDPSNFQVALLDNTANLIAPESAVVLNNQIYALTTQGVVTVSETGVAIISRPIELSLTSLASINYSVTQSRAFGIAYESQRAYYLHVPTLSLDTETTQYYRYNYITSAWTHGSAEKTCGGVNPVDDKLYLGNGLADIIDVERKGLTYSDYADYLSTQTISVVNGTLVTISEADTIPVGSIIYQSASVFGEVVSVDVQAGTVTTTLPVSFALSGADVLAPVSCVMAWAPVALGNPGISKHLREAALLFKSDFNSSATVSFSSDVSPTSVAETIAGSSVGGWGLFAWGGPSETPLGAPWGGDNRRRPVRVLVPRIHQRCSLLTVSFSHAYAYSPWALQGISLVGEGIGERTSQ